MATAVPNIRPRRDAFAFKPTGFCTQIFSHFIKQNIKKGVEQRFMKIRILNMPTVVRVRRGIFKK